MNKTEAFIDYMNGSKTKEEYLNSYPVEQRHFVRVPKRKSISRQIFQFKPRPRNPMFIDGRDTEPLEYLKRLQHIHVA